MGVMPITDTNLLLRYKTRITGTPCRLTSINPWSYLNEKNQKGKYV